MKSRSFRIITTSLGAIIVLSAVIAATVWVKAYITEKEEAELAQLAQEELADTYIKVNYAFHVAFTSPYNLDAREYVGTYIPLENPEIYNRFGVDQELYLTLKYYEKMTGVVIEYPTAIDYLSEEFEPDGTLRLYNNGRHPEIETFVDWMWQQREDQYVNMTSEEMWDTAPGHVTSGGLVRLEGYMESLRFAYNDYWYEHIDDGFERDQFNRLSPQMYDELVRKEADPDYELDLISLQQQGY